MDSNASHVCMKETATAFRQRRESLTTAACCFQTYQESHGHPHTASCIPARPARLLMDRVQTDQLFSLVHLSLQVDKSYLDENQHFSTACRL